eukprot:113491-Amphidinium_carterae.2
MCELRIKLKPSKSYLTEKLAGQSNLSTPCAQCEFLTYYISQKATLTFNNAANVLETWIQKYEVARKYGAYIEPQKMVAIIQRLVDAVRSLNGDPDQVFYMDYYNQLGI